MAMPVWNNVHTNFSGSNQSLASAQQGFARAGAGAEAMLERYTKDEQNALANERAQQALDIQKGEFGLRQKEYDDKQLAKVQGSKYLNDLGRTLEQGVINQDNQKQIAALSQDQSLSPEVRAARIDALMPKMAEAYQKDTTGQLQLMRGVTAGDKLDTATRIQALQTAEQPLEKKLDRDQQHEFRLGEISQQQKNALAVEGLRNKNELDRIPVLINAQTKAAQDKMDYDKDHSYMYNPTTNARALYKDIKTLPTEEQNKWIDGDTRKSILDASKIANDQKLEEKKFELKQAEVSNKVDAAITTSIAGAGNPDATGSVVGEMKAAKMPNTVIQAALATATGGGVFDFGKQDYDVGVLKGILERYKNGGTLPAGVKEAAEAHKKENPSEKAAVVREPFLEGTNSERAALLQTKEKEAADLYDRIRTTPERSGDETGRAAHKKLQAEILQLKNSLVDPYQINTW